MSRRSRATKAAFVASAASYAASIALGTGVKTGVVDSTGFHWAHHALYTATFALAGAAASTILWGRTRQGGRSRAGLAMLPAALPLSLIPAFNARSRTHVVTGLAIAPFVLAGLVVALKEK